MKKIASLFALLAVCLSLFSGCAVIDKTTLPGYVPPSAEEAYISEKPPVTDGSESNITVELLNRLETENFVKPKNIILMIGDGMGFNSIRAAKCLNDITGILAMELLPNKGHAKTYSTSDITDSAAAATALATGFKTDNGKIGILPNEDATQSVLELASKTGRKTGVVATKNVTDATPAGFTAHAEERGLEENIALQQLKKLENGELDLLLGGGRSVFNSSATVDALQKAKESGVNYITSSVGGENSSLPLLGLFCDGYLPIGYRSYVNLAEMTQTALDYLKGDDGFFLMVEGSQIDTQSHGNNAAGMAEELLCFDDAVSLAMRFVAENPDTVLIVTADHETGGINLPDGEFTTDDIKYTTTGHTAADVPVFAIGYGTEALATGVDNTDISKFIAKLLGQSSFGRDSDSELIRKLKSRVALSAYNLDIEDITINDAFSEYYGTSFVDESCIAKSISEAERLKPSLQTEIASKHDYLIFTEPLSDDPQGFAFVKAAIYVPKNVKLMMNGKQLATVNGKFSGTLEYGKDFFDDYVEFTLTNSFATSVIKHPINISYTAYTRFVDLSSEEVYARLKDVSANKFAQNTFIIENGVLNIKFSSSFSRFTVPGDLFLTGRDISHYSHIRMTVKNTSESQKDVFPLYLSAGSSMLNLSPSVKTLQAGQSAVIDYYLDSSLYGPAVYESIVSMRFISVDSASFEVSDIFIYNKK